MSERFQGDLLSLKLNAWPLIFQKCFNATTPDIQALRTPEDVYEEGCERGSCGWSLPPHLVTGILVLCRILSPERATLALEYSREGLRINELEGTHSQPVSLETEQVVQRWLDEMSSGDNGQPEELFADAVKRQ